MRLFVALDLPADARGALAAWADAAAPAQAWRVPPANLHVTLAFLGSREERDAAAVGGLLAEVARPLPPLRVAGPLWLPARRPRVLALALHDDGALAALQAELVAALVTVIGYEREQRPYLPHVTVASTSRGAGLDPRSALHPPAAEVLFSPCALTLYRSLMGSGGVRYEPLTRVRLG